MASPKKSAGQPSREQYTLFEKQKRQQIVGEFAIRGLQISLASPEYIRSLSKGEVTTFETINYKSLKPEKNGLFCEAIFGPIKDYECSCGKYKQVKYKGKRCEKCKVCITQSLVRRDWMGHIELACPVAHIWMIKELPLPAKISLILGVKYKCIEEVVYFNNYIVLDPGKGAPGSEGPIFNILDIIDVSGSKASAPSMAKLRNLLRNIYENIAANNPSKYLTDYDYQQGRTYYKALTTSNLPFSIMDMFEYLEKHTGLRVGIGAEAIYELLQRVNLEDLEYQLTQELNSGSSINHLDPKVRRILARLRVVRWFKESGNKPEWMILKVIPVIPPNLRPIIQLDGGRFTASDINTFYRRIIVRNDRLARILKLDASHIIANNEKRMLQEAVDSLIDNASRKKPLTSKDRRPLKSITDHLKGKQGLFRQNLLGKRVDYSGRSVIVVGPELKMYQVGLPILMILTLFKPFIIGELVRKVDELGNEKIPIALNVRAADKMIMEQADEIWPIVQKVIKERPVLLNRAPTLHRLGIQAFEPIMVEGKAICLHPLVTTAFNADFDGDQMAVHLPLSKEAVHEARSLMLAPWQVLGPKDSKPIVAPSQDMVLGIYHLTTENKEAHGTGILFATVDEVVSAFQMKHVSLHSIIFMPTDAFPEKQFSRDGILLTTPGKVIFNKILPPDYKYVSNQSLGVNEEDIFESNWNREEAVANYKEKEPFHKGAISKLIEDLYDHYGCITLAPILDEIKNLGFEYSTHSCVTISAFDVPNFTEKYQWFSDADQEVENQKKYLKKGLITHDEKYKNVIAIWTKVKDRVSDHIKKSLNHPQFRNNPIVIMAKSGARGNISNFIQLSGMRGLMNRSYNYEQNQDTKVVHDIIEVPIKKSFIEGLTVIEYFNSSYGARKGMTDTAMKTSKSGYMTRKLVDAAQEVIVKCEDCGSNQGLWVEAIIDPVHQVVIKSLTDRILYKCSYANIVHPETGELIVGANEAITAEIAKKIEDAGIKRVQVRSVLHCRQTQGVCQKCFGFDLTTKRMIEVGTAIGVISAQSVGEPAIQLTMRTFHSGGVAGEANITQGFERLKKLFEIVAPKQWENSVISEISGVVEDIRIESGEKIVVIRNDVDVCKYSIDLNLPLFVEIGQKVSLGQQLCDGCIDLKKLLDISGIDAVRKYIIQEVQKVYWIQGIDISEKYIEIIVRQLTSKMRILVPNDSNLSMDEIVDYTVFVKECSKLLMNNKIPPLGVNIIFGLEEAPEKTNSFLAAASFQDTKKILIDASVKGQVDYLVSLKENIIVGNLIPAGTGLKTPDEVVTDQKSLNVFNY